MTIGRLIFDSLLLCKRLRERVIVDIDICQICKKDWDTCPHTQRDLVNHKKATQLAKLIRKIVKEELQNEINKPNRPTSPRSFC